MPDKRGTPRHGTPSCYGSGCRCDECKKANSEYLKRWRVENKEKYYAGMKRWQDAHPESMRLSEWAAGQRYKGLPPTPETVQYAKILFADPCSYCGATGEAIDHIVARSRGGDGDWTNITAACGSCNSQKYNKSLLHFMLGRVS